MVYDEPPRRVERPGPGGVQPTPASDGERSGLRVPARRAVEALRAGVPNHDAVMALGGGQPRIEARFSTMLEHAADDVANGTQQPGLLIAGDFGTGKSHLLEALEQLALRQNFVCSTVVVSKEMPLHDSERLYRAAIRAARVPGRRGNAMTEIAFGLDQGTQAYEDLVRWASDPASGLGSRFPASLYVFQRTHDEETKDRIISFWGGDPLNAVELRRWLRAHGEASTFPLERIAKADLAPQHFRFTSRLISAAGYAGWVLLVDELELISQYAFKSRARAYASLARWSGRIRDQRCPGLVSLFAITQDFATLVLRQRNDMERIPGQLRARGTLADDALADGAEVGMRMIEQDRLALTPPDVQDLDGLRERLREIHGVAHDWQPPEIGSGERSTSTSMRQYVRRWINEWDLLRLYPTYSPSTVSEELVFDYEEDADLDREETNDGSGGA